MFFHRFDEKEAKMRTHENLEKYRHRNAESAKEKHKKSKRK